SLPTSEYRALADASGLPVEIVAEDSWRRTLATGPAARVRLIGGSASEVLHAIGGRPDIAIYDHPVTEAGRLELLPFVLEQAISITAHRFGTPHHLTDTIL